MKRSRRPATEPLVYTADELAGLLGVDRKTVYDRAGTGEIPCKRLGRRILFHRPTIERWLSGAK